MTYSLQARAVLLASLVLALFLIATGVLLDEAFEDSAEAAMRERLQSYAETLKVNIEKDYTEGLRKLPQTLSDRLGQPNSGLYGVLKRRSDNRLEWLSDSALDLNIPWPSLPEFWSARLDPIQLADGTELYVLSLNVPYGKGKNRTPVMHLLQVAETLNAKESYYYRQVRNIRHDLWRWFAWAALALLILQVAILRQTLAPLRRVAADLRAIEAGREERLTGRYPREVQLLSQNLNALLDQAESHLARYRHALGDLAHSLKTPLAVLRNALDDPRPETDGKGIAKDQIERMNRIIEYQLKRAAASGRCHLTPPVSIAEKARQILSALAKVHNGKDVGFETDIGDDLVFRGDEGDLMEILGNLGENAFKWCRSQVALSASRLADSLLEIRIEDDGPGIPPELAQSLLKRGERADPSVPGHGLGLAIVNSIVCAYGGRLAIERSELGGAALLVRLPA